jgi:hypothetical protein
VSSNSLLPFRIQVRVKPEIPGCECKYMKKN